MSFENKQSVTIDDLVRPLSLDTLIYFTRTKLGADWLTYESLRSGKFVRLGAERIFLGSTIRFEEPDEYRSGRYKSLLHWQISNAGVKSVADEVGMDAAYQELESSDERIIGQSVIVDAGKYSIRANDEGSPAGLHLDGESYDFGRADEAGRARTGEVARRALGSSVEVIVT